MAELQRTVPSCCFVCLPSAHKEAYSRVICATGVDGARLYFAYSTAVLYSWQAIKFVRW